MFTGSLHKSQKLVLSPEPKRESSWLALDLQRILCI